MKKLWILLFIGIVLIGGTIILTVDKPIQINFKEMITSVYAADRLEPKIVDIGDKVAEELCTPIIKTWTEEIIHKKTCTNCINKTIEANQTDKGSVLELNETYYKIVEVCSDYSCLDYIEYIEHKDKQVDCTINGKVKVEDITYEGNDAYCKIDETKICCYSNLDGGKYAATSRTDGSVDKECKDIITNEVTLISSTGKRFMK